VGTTGKREIRHTLVESRERKGKHLAETLSEEAALPKYQSGIS
jgi:hypothetical protein